MTQQISSSNHDFNYIYVPTHAKGQLISKANCQAANSSEKQINKLVYTSMPLVFIHFLEEIEDLKKTIRNYPTFMYIEHLLRFASIF